MNKQVRAFLKSQSLLVKLHRSVKNGYLFKSSGKKSVKGSGNKISCDRSATFVECKFDIVGDNNEVIIKDGALFVHVTFFIRGNNNKIVISSEVRFREGGSLWIEDENCEIFIGENTSFEEAHISVTEPNSKIEIGSDCMFAYDIDIRTGDSHSIIDVVTNKRINYAKNVQIGHHVWVAAHVSILKGTKISSNSIVATRSVVTRKFEQENVLIGGTPASVLKENVNWDRKRIYDR